ncbi:MAG TPA: VOC family protein [Burkholderiales bacterium]|jgi:catechol 2,3-dioxygenase-like lactoylglutathione lyase family enzyme
MFDHIGVRVKDLKKSARLYEAMLAPLGHVAGSKGDGYAGFGPKGKPALWLHADQNGGGGHVALRAPDRAAVDLFYKEGLKAGAKDNGFPGIRADYSPTYYAAFLIDLDGNNVEAVCMSK